MTSRTYLRAVVPIGVFYSASLVCSNLVYLYLNVAFIQMLKAGGPVAVLVISYLWGVSSPSSENVLNVLGIAVGVALASAGEIRFSWVGFLFQAGGVVFEAMRLVMIQVLLSGDDMKMDPLVSLYYYAPVCAAMNFFVALFTEVPSFQVEHLFSAGVSMLLLNALVAFMLNVASVFLVCYRPPSHCISTVLPVAICRVELTRPQIGKTSSLVLTLAGILKAIALVSFSVLFRGEVITPLQAAGYAVALFGLVYYSLGWEQIKGLASTTSAWVSESLDDSRCRPMVRKVVGAAVAVLVVLMLVVGLRGGGGEVVETPDAEGWGFSWMSKLGWGG